jgi:hypothetical protein
VRDYYAAWTGSDEIISGMSRLDQVSEYNDPAYGNFAVLTRPSDWNYANKTRKSSEIWMLFVPGFRRPATPSELASFSSDQSGFLVDKADDFFGQTAVHEARHIWQQTLSYATGASDDDGDFLVGGALTSPLALRDQRFSLNDRSGADGLNPEYDLLRDIVKSCGTTLIKRRPFPRWTVWCAEPVPHGPRL